MKKYRVLHWNKGKLKPCSLAEISHKNRWVGEYICFYSDGKKQNQHKFKNGIDKEWLFDSKNWFLKNWKKYKAQGIEIRFQS